MRKRFGSSFYMFFPPPGPAVCELGLARSAEVFTLVLGPSFDLPCLLAPTILDSFSLFYLPNMTRMRWGGIKREESKVASNHFLIWAPQSGPFGDVHEVLQRREEGGRRQGGQEDKRGE